MLVNLSIKTVIFPDADRNQFYYPTPSEPKLSAEDMKIQQDQQDKDTARQHQRDLAQAVAMILVGAPLYLYHWKTIQKDHALSQK